MRLPSLRRRRVPDVSDERMATATRYANHFTQTGSRCHLNDGSVRFCHWHAEALASVDAEGNRGVGVRCTIHPGGRYLDSNARLAPEDFAAPGD